MELSILHVFVDHNNYKGVLRFSIKKHFHNLCIEMQMHRINMQSNETIESFRSNLESDPTNPQIIDVIPTENVLTEKFYLVESEKVIEDIKTTPDLTLPSFQVNLGPNLACVLKHNQVKRIYNFFNSFVTNFALLDSIYKIYINMIREKEEIVKQPESVSIKSQEKLVLKQPTTLIKEEQPEKTEDLAPENKIEYIINKYCINNRFRSFVIHHIFNHLRYISNSVKVSEEVVEIPILFDNYYYGLNYDYVISIFKETFGETDINVISFNQKKILEMLVYILEEPQDSETKLILALLFFLFYTYQFHTILIKYPDFNFEEFFTPETQQAGINHFIKQTNIQKKFDIKILEPETDIDNDLIDEISLKYKHLIPISEMDFLEIAINEYKKPKEFKITDFKVSNRKILDIDMIMNNDSAIKKIINDKKENINTSIYNSRSCASSLLNFEQKIITKTFQYFKDYVNDPTTLSSLLLVKDLPIPKQVVNLYEFFSRNISKLFTDKDNNSTLSYYRILTDSLPAPASYNHQTYLYLIFNLIIPFHYESFNITKFEDVFL